VVITKVDLAPSCDFDLEQATTDIQSLNSSVPVMPLSAKAGEGLEAWYDWVKQHLL